MKGFLATRSLSAKLFMLFTLLLLGAIVFTSVGMGLAVSVYGLSFEEIAEALSQADSRATAELLRLVQGFATVGTFLVPALVGAYLFSLQPQRFLGLESFAQPPLAALLLIVLISFSGGFLSDALYQLSVSIPWPESWEVVQNYIEASQNQMNARYQSFLDMPNFLVFMRVLLVMALLPAVAEEAFFRGVLQPLLSESMGQTKGVFITAFVFALLHQQPLAFLSIFALGVILGYLRAWSGSLWVSTLAHFMNNGAIVVWVFFTGDDYLTNAGTTEWVYSLGMLVVLVLSLGLFKKYIKPRQL